MGTVMDANYQSSKGKSLLLVLIGFAIAVYRSIFRSRNTLLPKPAKFLKKSGDLNNTKDYIIDLTSLMGDKKWVGNSGKPPLRH